MRMVSHSGVRLVAALTLCGSVWCVWGCARGQRTDVRPVESSDVSVRAGSRAGRSQRSRVKPAERSRRELKAVAVETLLGLSTDPRAEIRANALEALQGHTQSLESVVALGLSDPNAGVRSVAAMVVGKQEIRSLWPMLDGLVDEESAYVRASALFAQSKVGKGSVDLTPLSVMLLEGEDIRASSHAAYVLGELGNQSALPLLEQASVRDWDYATPIRRQLFRLQVAEAMIKLGDRASMDAVRSALYPSRPEELEATALAVQIIGEVGDRGAIDQLIYLVDEETSRPMPAEVRLAVAGALAKLGLREGGFIADEYAENGNPVIRSQSAAVYGRTGQSEHLPKLEGMLMDESAHVRAGSAGAILEILGR